MRTSVGLPGVSRPLASPRRSGLLVAGLLVAGLVALTGCTGDDPTPPPTTSEPPATGTVPTPTGDALTLDFDSGPTTLGGPLAAGATASVVALGGGRVESVDSYPGAGKAAGFPNYSGAPDAPRVAVLIDGGPDDPFSPGEAPVTLLADIRLRAGQSSAGGTDNGDNIVQRGLFDSGAQLKLQADHDAASCRMLGDTGEVSLKSPKKLKRDAWYRLQCTRDGDTVTLAVIPIAEDGTLGKPVVATRSGPIGAITFPAGVPISVGGKLNADGTITAAASDEFNGDIDNVAVHIG